MASIEGARLVWGPGGADGTCAPGVWDGRGGVCEGERKGSGVPGGETSRCRVRMRVSTDVKPSLKDLWAGGRRAFGGVARNVEVVSKEREDAVSVGVVHPELGGVGSRILPKRLRTLSKCCSSCLIGRGHRWRWWRKRGRRTGSGVVW